MLLGSELKIITRTYKLMAKTGRPIGYSDLHLEKAKKYLNDYEGVIPSVAGLALYLNVARSTVYLWADEFPEFSDTLERILTSQEVKALNNGLSGDFNSAITKLVLHNHGYSDKAEIDNNVEFAVVSDIPSTEEWEDEHSSK